MAFFEKIKSFSDTLVRAPIRAFSMLVSLILGGPLSDKQRTPGLAGLILDSIKNILSSISALIKRQENVLATAFWAAFFIAGAAALTVAFIPAALTAVVSFSIAGVSIASLVGSGFIAQVAAVATVAAAAAIASVVSIATVVKAFNAIKSLFSKTAPDAAKEPAPIIVPEEVIGSHAAMTTGLNASPATTATQDVPVEPVMSSQAPLFVAKTPANNSGVAAIVADDEYRSEDDEDNQSTASMSSV